MGNGVLSVGGRVLCDGETNVSAVVKVVSEVFDADVAADVANVDSLVF